MSLFVKICGLATRDDALAVAELRPDAMGFVLWPRSKRFVRPEMLAEWIEQLPAAILKVGVFVDAKPKDVRRTMISTGLDVAQLHGSEDPAEYVDPAFEVWRVARPERDGASLVDGWPVDAVVVDTYSPTLPGGTGQVGDWEAARTFVAGTKHRVLLAGGLTPSNVREAVRVVQPWGVDVSSGVEESPGRKDLQKVREFIERCRDA
jgi:phosphoribosylanthranilate isomerase